MGTDAALALGASVATPQEAVPTTAAASRQPSISSISKVASSSLKRPEGFYVRLHVPETFTNWDALKVGNTINATYYENVILKIEKAGAAAHTREPLTPPKNSAEAHGSPDVVRIVTATITAVDAKLSRTSSSRSGVVAPSNQLAVLLAERDVDLTYTQATLFELK